MPPSPLEAALDGRPLAAAAEVPPIPHYLEHLYWWAYVHPNAVSVFEREWLVNAILFGNYGRLRDAALADLGEQVQGRTLQVACVYGNLTVKLCDRLADGASLDVVDILPVQLDNLRRKLAPGSRVTLKRGDASSLDTDDQSYEQVLLFFLLHEMPEAVRRGTLSEALRVLKPGGKLVITDYHRPARWHPLRPLMHQVFNRLEPYAHDLWDHEIEQFLPKDVALAGMRKQTYFGGLYQKLVLTR